MGGEHKRSYGGGYTVREIQAARKKQKNQWLASLRKQHSRRS